MSYGLGVDLGTTRSAAAIVEDGQVSMVSFGLDATTLPSVVFADEDGNVLVGDSAARRGAADPTRLAREFKRRTGDPEPLILGGAPWSPSALTARLLRSILDQVAEREGDAPDRVTLTHPANWGPYKTDLLLEAAQLGGITEPLLITEPEAAALHYGSRSRVPVDATVAVYDLGGGTFDATVLRKSGDGFRTVGKPDGLERFGGIDIDAAVRAHVRRVLGDDVLRLDPTDPAAVAAMARLNEECVRAKEALSSDLDVSIPVLLPGVATEVRLTRAELENMVRPVLVDTVSALRRTLASADVAAEDLTAVLLVGGASRMPLVARMLTEELGRPVAVDAHPKHAIAFGAALAASDGAAAPDRSRATAPRASSPQRERSRSAPSTHVAASATSLGVQPAAAVRRPAPLAPEPTTSRFAGTSGRTSIATTNDTRRVSHRTTLCRVCRTKVPRDFPYCLRCGTLRRGAKISEFAAPVLTTTDPPTTTTLVTAEITIGREAGSDIVIDHPTVSRQHARVVRRSDGFHVHDCGSANGTSIRLPDGFEQALGAAPAQLYDGATIYFGDVEATFTQPRPLGIGGRTEVRGTAHTRLRSAEGGDEDPATVEPLSARPRRRSGWALKELANGGDRTWMLSNTRTSAYQELDERQLFLWQNIDGRRSVRDLLYLHLERFGELALPWLNATLRDLSSVGLVDGLAGKHETGPGWRNVARSALRSLVRFEISGFDGLVERLYLAFVWRFFTGTAAAARWVLVLGGLYGFWVASTEQNLFDLAGTGLIGAAVIAAGFLAGVVMHEAAHAFAVKSYGRRVRGGIRLLTVIPLPYVDTSDMWFGTPYSRIVVALSGPLTTTAAAGCAALTAAYVPIPQVAAVAFALAFLLYAYTVIHLLPLLPLDGYHAFADALQIPQLGARAGRYLLRGLWKDLRHRRRPPLGQVAFGLASLVTVGALVALVWLLWLSVLGDIFRAAVDPVGQMTIIVGAAVVLLVVLVLPHILAARSGSPAELHGGADVCATNH